MSVPAEARSETKLTVLIEARRLVRHSLRNLANNNVFKAVPSGDEEDDRKNPPQPELIARMKTTILDAYLAASAANDTPFTKDNYRHRRQLQDKSLALLNEMKALVELSVPVFHLSLRRADFWIKFIVGVRNRIQAWKESDYKRYKRM